MSLTFKILLNNYFNHSCHGVKHIIINKNSTLKRQCFSYIERQKLGSFYQIIFKQCKKNYKTKRNKFVLGMSLFGPSLLPKANSKEMSVPSVHVIPTFSENSQKRRGNNLLYRIYELVRVLLRSLRLCLTFVPIFILYPITYLGSYPQELWWKILLIGVEHSGPIFIKFGQWASTRRDIFSESFCNQFARLQRRSKPHSWHYTEQQLLKAFGKNWRKIFVKFDNNYEPIGSGCVAQVYKVWVNEDQIKNKDVLDEIISEHQDDEEDKMSIIDDGLEILGFHNWWTSLRKKIYRDEKESILAFKRARELKRKLEKENEMFRTAVVETHLPSDVKDITTELADEIMCPGEKSDRGNDGNHLNHGEISEHVLVEQWQNSPESLEKSLPLNEEDLEEDLEGLVPIALKVLHPKMYRTFTRDMKIFKFWCSFITFICPPLKWLNLEECFKEFYRVMAAQIDLRKEAENLDRFIVFFSDVDTVRFPRPVRPFVTRRILVETFEEGEPMLNFITDNKPEALKKNLAKIGIDTILKMIFTDNFVHSDLHPGNILVQNENKSENEVVDPRYDGNTSRLSLIDVGGDTFVLNVVTDPKPLRICILDCGIVATLKEKDLSSIRAVFEQVILGRGDSVADLFLARSEHLCSDPDSFRRGMNKLVRAARSNAISLEQVDVGLLLQKVLGLLLQHHIRLESAFSAVVLAVFVLEGLGRSLDPQVDILERARPLLVS